MLGDSDLAKTIHPKECFVGVRLSGYWSLEVITLIGAIVMGIIDQRMRQLMRQE